MELTSERVDLKIIGYTLNPKRRFFRVKDIGKEFGISYRGGSSKVLKSISSLVDRNLLEIYTEGKYNKLYKVKDKRKLENLYNDIFWKTFLR